MNLDNTGAIRKLDKKNVSQSIANLPRQLTASWTEAKKTRLPPAFGKAENIVFCGMGGSNLASELLRSVFGSQIKTPFVLVRNYDLPAFAGKNSLVIIDSYSGNTEEAVSCLNQAIGLKAKIVCISSGGLIAQLAKRNKLAHFKINPSLNPSGQPRYDIGSQLGTALYIFSKLKFIAFNERNLSQAVAALSASSQDLLPESKLICNAGKQLARKLAGKNVFIVGAGYLSGNAHIMANQINESAKQLATPHKLPELNHHFLEALVFPRQAVRDAVFIFLQADDFSQQIKKRIMATRNILDKKRIANYAIESEAATALGRSLETLVIGGWVSFYLAMLNGANPSDIPWVDYLKSELKK